MHQTIRNTLTALDWKEGEPPPVVDFHLYFEGNTEEECIAPNQWGEGRPPIAELYARFKEIAAHPSVERVLVGLHESWNDESFSRADWNPLALICTIELARPKNPDIPDEIREGYFQAFLSIPYALAEKPCHIWDDLFTQVAAASLALSRGHRAFAEIYLEFSFSEAKKWLAEYWDVEESQLGLQGL